MGLAKKAGVAKALDEARRKLDLEDLQALNSACYPHDTDVEDAVACWREADGL